MGGLPSLTVRLSVELSRPEALELMKMLASIDYADALNLVSGAASRGDKHGSALDLMTGAGALARHFKAALGS